MKKITLLFTLALLPILGMAQTFEFNNSAEGWTGVQATLTENTASINLAFDAETAPKLRSNSAGVDAGINKIVSITLKNNSNVSEIRFVYDDLVAGSGSKGVTFDISSNDSDFQTYYLDLSGRAEWDNNGAGGIQQNIDFAFREPGSAAGGNKVDTAGDIDVDQVSFISEIPRSQQLVFDFETADDSEGWTAIDGNIMVSGGALTLSGIEDGTFFKKKIENLVNNVNADEYKFLVVTYQNNSAENDQLRFAWGGGGQNQNIMTSTSGSETVVFDLRLEAEPDWTGITQDFQLTVRNTANADNQNAASVGTFVIEQIEFSNDETLSTESFAIDAVSIYPNPAKHTLYINGYNNLSKVEMFDITGKRVMQAKTLMNEQLDISGLNSGMYLLRLYDTNNTSLTKKLIIAN